MEERRQKISMDAIAKTNSSNSFSHIDMAIQDQDQDQDRYPEFKFGHVISGSTTKDDVQDQEQDFEFGRITPGSPTNDPSKNSPADLLFFNGRLLPHAFPFESARKAKSDRFSQGSSCTSSISSKDSLMSSRSNSSNSNSRSSSCSSARTSSSEYSEKRWSNSDEIGEKTVKAVRNQANKIARLQPHSATQRWHFIAPAPTLTTNAESSRRKKSEVVIQEELRSKKHVKDKLTTSSWFGWRFFHSFISMCRECHALEPSMKEDELQGKF